MIRTLGFLISLVIFVATTASAVFAEKRVALVIGNDDYSHVTKLQKAVNDAKAMAQALRSLGFAVSEAPNVARRDMSFAVQQFVNQIAPGDVAMVFFAGHGVEIKGENFLLPTDIPNGKPGQEGFIKSESISLNDILTRLKGKKARLNVVILDACRNNPFSRSVGRGLGATRGLARVAAPQGTFVMYSADAGESALDRLKDGDADPNSVFTRTLIPLMKKPGLDLVSLARQVRRQVRELALSVSHQQTPAYYDAVLGDFYFSAERQVEKPVESANGPALRIEADYKLTQEINTQAAWRAFLARYSEHKDNFHVQLAEAALNAISGAQSQQEPKTQTSDQDQARIAWAKVQNSDNIETIENFLQQNPGSAFVAEAQRRLEELKANSTNSSAAEPQAIRFDKFPVTKIYKGRTKFPQFGGRDRAYKSFRTRIRQGLKNGPNFAGRYSMIRFGCGSGCTVNLIADNRTGQVFDFPRGGEDNMYLELAYNVASRLVVAQWGNYEPDSCMLEQFEWTGKKLQLLSSVKVGKLEDCFSRDLAEIVKKQQ